MDDSANIYCFTHTELVNNNNNTKRQKSRHNQSWKFERAAGITWSQPGALVKPSITNTLNFLDPHTVTGNDPCIQLLQRSSVVMFGKENTEELLRIRGPVKAFSDTSNTDNNGNPK